MEILINNFRLWWQYPRKVEDRSEHRSVAFLELFYDLVYVVFIAELAHSLAGQVDWRGLANYLFLFVIVWLSWLNGMSYHDVHGNNDIRTRVFTFLQMICVAAMAVFAHDALGETSSQFAIAYGLFLLTLSYLWWRVCVHDEELRALAQPYSIGFLVATLLFFASAFVPDNIRIYLWWASVAIMFFFPIITLSSGRKSAAAKREIDKMVVVSPSNVERFGLLTIIVLGEVVVGVVGGLTDQHHLTLEVGVIALLGMLVAIGLWWVYFDFVSHRIPRPSAANVGAWTYVHLPLVASIAAVGAAVLNSIEHVGEGMPSNVRWLLVGGVSIALLCVAIIINTLGSESAVYEGIDQRSRNIMLICAAVTVIVGFLQLPPIMTLSIIAVLLLAPIFFGLKAGLEKIAVQKLD